MADKKPVFTENFSANLTTIQDFLGPERANVYQRLLARLFDDIIPTLSTFPRSGRSFLDNITYSNESVSLVSKLMDKLKPGDDLREFIVDDYLVLYIVRGNRIFFLSIKHHRQLSYELKRFWRQG